MYFTFFYNRCYFPLKIALVVPKFSLVFIIPSITQIKKIVNRWAVFTITAHNLQKSKNFVLFSLPYTNGLQMSSQNIFFKLNKKEPQFRDSFFI